MSTHEPTPAKIPRRRLHAFRALGGALLVFAFLGLAAAGVGVYFTIKEAKISGWLAPFLVGAIGVAAGIMVVVGFRALRIKSVEDLEARSRSKWLEP
jgi:hypothetical protein